MPCDAPQSPERGGNIVIDTDCLLVLIVALMAGFLIGSVGR